MKIRHLTIVGILGMFIAGPALAQTSAPQDPQTMSKPKIQQVQQTLKQFGYDPGNVDGVWGPESAQALAQFQANRSLPATKGMIDGTTASALHLKLPSTASD